MIAESYSSKTDKLHIQVQRVFLAQLHETAIEFQYETEWLYFHNPFLHKVDEKI